MTTKAQAARDYKAAHPLASASAIAIKLGMARSKVLAALDIGSDGHRARAARLRRAAYARRHALPARVAVRELIARGCDFRSDDVRMLAGCANEPARRAIAYYIDQGKLDVVRAPNRGHWGIYRSCCASKVAA